MGEGGRVKRSWWDRNWIWAAPCGCLVSIGVCGLLAIAAGGGALAWLTGSTQASWPFETGLELARNNAAVVEVLGEPIEAGWMISGSFNLSGASGSADFSIPVSGPRGRGRLYIVAEKTDGEWTMLEAEFAPGGGGERIDLLDPGTVA